MSSKMKKNNVTINVDQNIIWKVERVYPLEKPSYWWTKPQLKQIRDEYKNEVMMEGVRNLVKARVEQEEKDAQIIEQRVNEIMKLDPGSIANILQSIPSKTERLSMKFNSILDPSNDSISVSDSDSDSDTDSESDSDTDSDTDSDSGSSSSSSSSSLSENNDEERRDSDHLGRVESSLKIKTKSKAFSPNDSDDDSLSSSCSSKDKNDLPSSSTLLSPSHVSISPKDRLINPQSNIEKSRMQGNNAKTYNPDLPPATILIQPVHETMPSKKLKNIPSCAITPLKSKSIESKTNPLDGNEQKSDMKLEIDLRIEKGKSAKNRFRQGVLTIVAMDRLRKLAEQNARRPTSIHTMSSSSCRLLDMYLPSDEENEDEKDSIWSDEGEGEGESALCEETSDCPLCLGLVDPSQQRKIMLLRRMLCKGCFFSYYINRRVVYGSNNDNDNSSKRTNKEIRQNDVDLNFNEDRDVQILTSSKLCVRSTDKSPVLPVLPMTKRKSSILRDNCWIKAQRAAKSHRVPNSP